MKRALWGMFCVRIIVGSVFLIHGVQKIWWNFAGTGFEGYLQWAQEHGFNSYLAYYGAHGELLAGILLIGGFAAEIGALLTIPIMICATFIVLWPQGYFAQNGGYEYTLNLMFLACSIIIGGPGYYALWDPFKNKLKK